MARLVRGGARPPLSRTEQLVLGLPSLVLGAVPLAAPRRTARLLGLPLAAAVPTLVRLVGARELAVALAFLRGRSPRWLWGFVAQDAVDVPVLVVLLVGADEARRRRLTRALVAYLAMTTVDVATAVTQDLRGRTPGVSGARPRPPANPPTRPCGPAGCA